MVRNGYLARFPWMDIWVMGTLYRFKNPAVFQDDPLDLLKPQGLIIRIIHINYQEIFARFLALRESSAHTPLNFRFSRTGGKFALFSGNSLFSGGEFFAADCKKDAGPGVFTAGEQGIPLTRITKRLRLISAESMLRY
jgi:hypothetical protein